MHRFVYIFDYFVVIVRVQQVQYVFQIDGVVSLVEKGMDVLDIPENISSNVKSRINNL